MDRGSCCHPVLAQNSILRDWAQGEAGYGLADLTRLAAHNGDAGRLPPRSVAGTAHSSRTRSTICKDRSLSGLSTDSRVSVSCFGFAVGTTSEASAPDLDLYQRSANSLRRLLEAVGLQRRTKPVETLQDYLARQ